MKMSLRLAIVLVVTCAMTARAQAPFGRVPQPSLEIRGATRAILDHIDKPADLDAFKGKLKGAWVLTREVSTQPSPKRPEPELFPMAGDRRGRPGNFEEMRRFRESLRAFLISEGVAGLLLDSNKEHGLVN